MIFFTVFIVGVAAGIWTAIGVMMLGERRAERKFLKGRE